jgi:hypothetical protein
MFTSPDSGEVAQLHHCVEYAQPVPEEIELPDPSANLVQRG